jgi:hypothetical protein
MNEISPLEEALASVLGIKFGKLTFKQSELTTSHKFPQGEIIRKTRITEIIRDGEVIKRHIAKAVPSVI